jgi:hypothetical protein
VDETIKLGLGDFVFYSVLVSRAAKYDFSAMIGCLVSVLMVRTILLNRMLCRRAYVVACCSPGSGRNAVSSWNVPESASSTANIHPARRHDVRLASSGVRGLREQCAKPRRTPIKHHRCEPNVSSLTKNHSDLIESCLRRCTSEGRTSRT